MRGSHGLSRETVRRSSRIVLTVVGVLLGGGPFATRADSIGVQFSSAPTTTGTSAAVNGLHFSVGAAPVLVTQLGYFDLNGDGLATSHTVGIYDDVTQSLVASVDVPAGTAGDLDNSFRFESIVPALLAANHSYTLVGTIGAGTPGGLVTADALTYSCKSNYAGLVIDPRITISDHAFVYATDNGGAGERTTLRYPTETYPPGDPFFAEFGPNLKLESISAVPLPSAAWGGLALFGGLGLARLRRRARDASAT